MIFPYLNNVIEVAYTPHDVTVSYLMETVGIIFHGSIEYSYFRKYLCGGVIVLGWLCKHEH